MLLSITNTGDGDFVLQDPLGIVNFSITVAPSATVSSEVSTDLLFRLKALLDAASTVTYTVADTEADSTQSGVRRVRAGTTGAIVLSAPQTIDNVAVIAGDRVLVKNQVAGATNGIYVVKAGAWVRAVDMDTTSEVKPDVQVLISEGNTLADTAWVLTTNAPITLGTTALTFQQLTQVPADGSITYTKLQNVSATDKLLGRSTAGAGVVEEIACTAAGRALIDDAAASNQRTTLGIATLIAGTPTFVVGAAAGNDITVTATLKDVNAAALGAKAKATVWISDAAGDAPSAAAPDGGVVFGTGTVLKIVTAGVLFEVVSDASGVIALTLTESGVKNYFVNIAIGNVVASSAVAAFT